MSVTRFASDSLAEIADRLGGSPALAVPLAALARANAQACARAQELGIGLAAPDLQGCRDARAAAELLLANCSCGGEDFAPAEAARELVAAAAAVDARGRSAIWYVAVLQALQLALRVAHERDARLGLACPSEQTLAAEATVARHELLAPHIGGARGFLDAALGLGHA